MVARNKSAETSAEHSAGMPARLLLVWRRALTTLFGRPSAHTKEPDSAVPAPRGTWLTSHWLIGLGAAGLMTGITLSIVLAASGQDRRVAVVVGAETLIWALVRWLLMRTAGRGVARDSRKLVGAMSLGLTVYAVGIGPELRLAAWLFSAVLTWLGLSLQGDRRSEATRSVGIAWGAQAAIVTLSWIARSGVVAFLATRG